MNLPPSCPLDPQLGSFAPPPHVSAEVAVPSVDDKRLQNTLKRLGVNNIPGIEEVNLFRDNGTVVHFKNPMVQVRRLRPLASRLPGTHACPQANIQANTYVISGSAENKKLQDLLPGIINQLGPDNLDHLKRIAGEFGAGDTGGAAGDGDSDSDDDVPELVEDFEQVSKK